jgi:hypothetical protein
LHPAPAAEHEARLILTDPPYNVPVAGHVTSGSHRELLMAAGEMSDAEFLTFNTAWIGASLRHLRDGGLIGTSIRLAGLSGRLAAVLQLSLEPSSSGRRPTPAWAASIGLNTSSCRYSRKARRPKLESAAASAGFSAAMSIEPEPRNGSRTIPHASTRTRRARLKFQIFLARFHSFGGT